MNNKNVKIIGAIVGVIMFMILIAGVTYAWISWQSDNTEISGNSKCYPNINYTTGSSLSADNILLFDENDIIQDNSIILKNGMAYLNVTTSIDDQCDVSVKFLVEMDVVSLSNAYISGNSVGALKYVLASYDPSITDLNELKGQSLEIIESNSITSTGVITIDDSSVIVGTKAYLLIFYVDGDKALNDAQYAEFSVNITGKAIQVSE